MSTLRRAGEEAVANILATPWRFGVVTIALAATLCWPAYREAALVRSLQQAKRSLAADGAFISVVTAKGAPTTTAGYAAVGIAGTSCDALNSMPGILSAGVLAPAGSAVPKAEPDGGIPLWRVSPGFVHLLAVPDRGNSVLLGTDAAGELGTRTGAAVAFVNPPLAEIPVVTVYPRQAARTALLDRAVLLVEPPASISGSCLVDTAGTTPNSAAEFLGALLGAPVDVRPLATPSTVAPDQIYAQRTGRVAEFAAPAFAVLVWLLLIRVRRAEIALARIFGAHRAVIGAQLVAEFAICVVLAAVPAAACVAAAGWGHRVAGAAGAASVVAGCALALALAAPGAVAMSVRRGSELRALRGAE